MKIALIRGAFLNQYETQIYYPLVDKYSLTAFCNQNPIHDRFPFPVVKLWSPMDINFSFLSRLKMPILNRIFVDAHMLFGLEDHLKGYDIAHVADTFYHFTYQAVLAKKKGYVRSIVATIFENIPFNNEGIWGRKRFKYEAIHNIDHFIAISERSKLCLMIEGVDEKKITVVGQHIDTKRFIPTRKKLSLNNVNILFIGRLEFIKGVYEIIYAAKMLSLDNSLRDVKMTFTFVGEGSEKSNLQELVRKMKIERIVKFYSSAYSEITQYYANADIFVAPSRPIKTYQEQFSTVLLEAQSSGLPIVTTGCGGIPENVGDAALMSNSADFYSLAKNIKALIINPYLREKFGKAARLHSLKWDINAGSNKIEKIYLKALK